MPQTSHLQSNNTENGWIYKKIMERIDQVEKLFKETTNTLDQSISDLNINLNDYNTIVNNLKNKVDLDNFNAHRNDSNIHVNQTQVTNWDRKLDLEDIENVSFDKDVNGDIKNIIINMKSDNMTFTIPVVNEFSKKLKIYGLEKLFSNNDIIVFNQTYNKGNNIFKKTKFATINKPSLVLPNLDKETIDAYNPNRDEENWGKKVDMVTINGRVVYAYKPETTYEKDALVVFNDSLYKCKNRIELSEDININENNLPFNKWLKICSLY